MARSRVAVLGRGVGETRACQTTHVLSGAGRVDPSINLPPLPFHPTTTRPSLILFIGAKDEIRKEGGEREEREKRKKAKKKKKEKKKSHVPPPPAARRPSLL